MIKDVIIFNNGNVFVGDENGKQMPEYQGFILDISEKLREGCDENTKWTVGSMRNGWSQELEFGWWWKKDKEREVRGE